MKKLRNYLFARKIVDTGRHAQLLLVFVFVFVFFICIYPGFEKPLDLLVWFISSESSREVGLFHVHYAHRSFILFGSMVNNLRVLFI